MRRRSRGAGRMRDGPSEAPSSSFLTSDTPPHPLSWGRPPKGPEVEWRGPECLTPTRSMGSCAQRCSAGLSRHPRCELSFARPWGQLRQATAAVLLCLTVKQAMAAVLLCLTVHSAQGRQGASSLEESSGGHRNGKLVCSLGWCGP